MSTKRDQGRKKKRPRRSSPHGPDVTDRATRRVIAPYVNIVRKGTKATVKLEKDDKYFTFYLKQKPTLLRKNLTEFLDDNVKLPILLSETADALKDATNAVGVRLYLVDVSAGDIFIGSKSEEGTRSKIRWKIQKGTSIAAYVASTLKYVVVDDIIADNRFPDAIPYAAPTIKSAICVPIVTPEDECYAVLELHKDVNQTPFQKSDLTITLAVAGWMGASVYMNEQIVTLHCQQRLNKCLIELTKCYFADTVLLEKMIIEIVSFAKQAVNAERTSFYVIDPESTDLAADVYDGDNEDRNAQLKKRSLKVRFGKERGVAGFVARTGIPVNIKDAYNDPKFNVEVDPTNGFITRSVLCMPVMGGEGVLGVAQAVNKVDGPCFTSGDEKMFKTFAFYCALALHYAYICRKSTRQEAKHEVVLGLLKRHVMPCEHDVEWILENPNFYENPEAIKEFTWYIQVDCMDHMPQIVIHMILDITGEECMDVLGLTKFILTVRNFYRKIPYHSWEHGFNVCHCMYNILLRNRDLFTATEQKALMIATICHDIDHGGVTNAFLLVTNNVMAQLYEESIWENHHYAVTMIILGEINVFNDISAEEFKTLSAIMRHAIIATDLANYFKMRGRLVGVLSDEIFDYDNTEHRNMMISIMMNVCDLSGQCKPFHITKMITEQLLEEFYAQGDLEKSMGSRPLSLLDRDQPEKVPFDQIVFLNVLVIPICDLVKQVLPNTSQLYDDAMTVKMRWLEVIEIQQRRCWRQADSVVR